jgi:RNA polymerase sigma factor (sigma-70 family)
MADHSLTRVLAHVRGLVAPRQGAPQEDVPLLRRFVAHRDEDAFAELLQRHGPMVLAVCRSVLHNETDAEDAFQATFLVLARRAASIRCGEALGPWLHRVAYRVSLTAKANATVRRHHERRAADMAPTSRSDRAEWLDGQLLQAEVDRLPLKYRLPVVLCYLADRTHDEAAQELGWPVGTVKGRLARARALLRARLVRRGFVLPASGGFALLAVPPALGESTLKAAVAFAATDIQVAGAVSTKAVALAEGVIRRMIAKKTKSVLGLLLILAVTAAGPGFLLRPAAAGKGEPAVVPLAKVVPAAPAPRAIDEKLRLTLAGSARTALLPDGSNVWSVKLQIVFKNVSDRPLKLDMSPLPYLTGTTLEVTGPRRQSVRFESSGWEFDLRAAQAWDFIVLQPGNEWTLTINFPIDAVGQGRYFLLDPGEYRLRATYRLLRETDSPFARGSWTGTVTSNAIVLKVEAADDFGQEVRGLRARVALAGKTFEVGEPVQVKYTKKNVSKAEQIVWHSGFWANHQVLVRDADRKEPPLTPEGARGRKAFSPGGERWKNVAVKLPPGGEDATEGNYDLTKLYDLSRPGRYTVQYIYEEKQGGWEGRLPSNIAGFEIVAAKKGAAPGMSESKPVRVAEADFQAVVEARPVAPESGATQPINLGLRITNRADKPQWFNLFDTIRIGLKSADGTPIRVDGGRNGTFPARPIQLAPGQSQTILRGGRLEWMKDGRSLRLIGSDGSGGIWHFDGLRPGKYRLRFEYETTREMTERFRRGLQAGGPFWISSAQTAEAEFEILPPPRKPD